MSSIECSLKSLTSPHSSELLQSHNSLTFKLLKTVADFSQALATLHDRFGHELQMLVETFRKRNGELRKERLNCPNSLFQIWELFLQQVEVNSQQHGDISRDLSQTNGSGLIERVFHRKIQSKKIFAHKERIEAILLKSNELLVKCYDDYCQAYALALTDPAQYLNEYIASHNVYVHQLQATNGMVHAYQTKTLPRLLEELEECQLETSSSITISLLGSSELIAEKSSEQATGYQNLALACKQANHRQDLAHFVKIVASTPPPSSTQQDHDHNHNHHHHQHHGSPSSVSSLDKLKSIRYHQFQAANWQQSSQLESLGQIDPKNLQIVPTFKNEIAPDFSQPPDQQQPKLEKDREQLEEKIEKFEERIEALGKLLARSSESRLHNKANELQEELCQRRFDLYVAQIHLSAVRSQLQLFEYNFRPLVGSASQLPLGGVDHSIMLAGGGGGDLASAGASGPQAVGAALGEQGQQQQPGAGPAGGSSATGGGPGLANHHGSRKSPQSVAGGGGVAGGVATPLGYRNKWIKAFKSLKETPQAAAAAAAQAQAQAQTAAGQHQKFSDSNSGDFQTDLHGNSSSAGGQQQVENQHFFQEYTFKKIASCDVCKDFLRGHMRQGVKCKLCKISCHNDCQAKAHGTIKCQQPKIKLLRRQKSAGEIEVNSDAGDSGGPAETSERPFSSKPDSIYSLIRQVLDAKKRGQHHAPQVTTTNADQDLHLLRPGFGVGGTGSGSGLASSQQMNLSMGNLALANQNGKSVSTSALPRPESSVDRWSVVMDLLAQSRHQSKHKEGAGEPGEGPLGGGGGGKRHSKQLDKFKLAARSVGKHQRYQASIAQQAEQQQQQQVEGSSSGLKPAAGNPQHHPHHHQHHQSLAQSMSASVGVVKHAAVGVSESGPTLQLPSQSHQYAVGDPGGPSTSAGYSGAGPAGVTAGPSQQQLSVRQAQQQQQQQQMMLVHHTKSLPVGQLPPAVAPGGPYGPHGLLVGAAQQQQPQQQQQQIHHMASQQAHGVVAFADHHLAGPASSNPIQQQQQQQHQTGPSERQYNQLLDIGLQHQLQSTSAPHSPQRKRFNLRMKSFSLDSPESPVVSGGVLGAASSVGPAGAYSNASLAGHLHSGGGSGGQVTNVGAPGFQHQTLQQYMPAAYQHHESSAGQQQQQQQARQYGGGGGQQQQQPTFYYQPPGSGPSATRGGANLNSSEPSGADEQHSSPNNYNHQAGTGKAQSQKQKQQQQQQREKSASQQNGPAGQRELADQGNSFNAYASNELLADARHFSSSSNSTADTYHSQSTLLRPGQQQTSGGPGPDGQRHSQQHRHSYHNPMSAAAYAYQEGALGAFMSHHLNQAALGNPFGGGAGTVDGLFGPGEMMASRHCASSSALDATPSQQHRPHPMQAFHSAVPGHAPQLPPSANKSKAKKQQQQHHGSGSQLNRAQQHQFGQYHLAAEHSSDHHQDQQQQQQLSNGNNRAQDNPADYYDLDVDHEGPQQQQQQSQQPQPKQSQQSGANAAAAVARQTGQAVGQSGAVVAGDTFVVLYDYAAQRSDEIQLTAGQLIQVLDTSERDWWKVGALDGTNRIGYFPSSYLAQLFQNERPLQVAQTIQVSNGETCDKLLRGQIVIHTGKQMDNFVTIRTIRANANPNDAPQALVNYIQCPEKYLLEVIESH